ncbi:hypothetical protein FRC10_004133, partial [Ceratobasidium sp. 414]
MLPPSPDPYGAAFSHWRRSETACPDDPKLCGCMCPLQSAFAVYPTEYSSRQLRAEACAGLDSQLPFLASYKQTLKEARFSLNSTRNISPSLMPINSLPLEILRTIFTMAVWQEADSVCAITSVCKLWRRTTLECLGCWSRIELPVGPGNDYLGFRRASLWAERARNELLHVSVWERPNSAEDLWYSDEKTSEVVEFLSSLMPRVRAIEFLDGFVDFPSLVPLTIACWVEHGTTGTAGVFRLHVRSHRLPVRIKAEDISRRCKSTSDEIKSFFSSLHTLSLSNAQIDPKLGFHSGLVDLRLRVVSGPLPDLVAILAACPGLRYLDIPGPGSR